MLVNSPRRANTLIVRGDTSHRVTFSKPVVRKWSVFSTACSSPQPASFKISEIPSSETSDKDTETKAEVLSNARALPRPSFHPQKLRAKWEASTMAQSLQLAAKEFGNIHKPKMTKLKGRYSAKAMLVFNCWIKDA